MKESYGTLSETINGLKKDGYLFDFNVKNGALGCSQTNAVLSPEHFVIDKVYRFEGASNPDDESILYAISSVQLGLKGILVNGYGLSADAGANAIISNLKLRNWP